MSSELLAVYTPPMSSRAERRKMTLVPTQKTPLKVPHALVEAGVAELVRSPIVQHPGLVRHLHVASGAHRPDNDVDRLAAHGDEHVDAGRKLAGGEPSTPAEHVRGVGSVVVGQ